MIAELLARAGVDYAQWKAVSRTLLRSDFRPPASQATAVYSLRTVRAWLVMALVFGMFGLSAAGLVALNPDVLLTGTVTLTYMMLVISTSVLTQHGTTILSTVDYAILAPRPVSSQTFLAIRVTNVLFHTLLITTLIAYPPIIAFTVVRGVNVWQGIAAALAFYTWAIAVTLALILAYGSILRTVGAARLQRALGYLQLAIGVLAYGAFVVLVQNVGRGAIAGMTLPRSDWLLLLPPTWFASYIEIATGAATMRAWIGVGLSIAVIAWLVSSLRGRVGVEYTERLGDTATPRSVADLSPRQPSRHLFFRAPEARAVSILVLAHFRHDTRVRMGIFGVLPMLLIYLFLGERYEGPDLMALTVLLFPSILTQQLGSSDAYRASWLYAVTPSDTVALITAMKNVIVVYFLTPFMILLAVLFVWRSGGVGDGLLHAGMLYLVGHAALQATMIVHPRLPFALPPDKVSGGASTMLWIIAIMVGGSVVTVALERWVYLAWTRIAVAAVALLLISWLLNRLLEVRIRRYSPQPTL